MLMTHFIQSSKLKRQIEQKTTAVLKRKLIQERLTHIFTQLSGGFTCENQKLSFSFYPNLKEDNPVTATLELDDDSLLLKYLIHEDKIEERIGDGIKTVQWEFLSSKIDSKLLKEWTSQDKELVSMRLTITDATDQVFEYAFFPNLSPPTLKASS